MTAEQIARELGGRRCGASWVARCPAHRDHSPSLSIRSTTEGKILVHCFSGCAQNAVIGALRGRGLWPEREWSPRERAGYRRLSQQAERLARQIHDWGCGLAIRLDAVQKEIAAALLRDDDRRAEYYGAEAQRIRRITSSPEALASAYAGSLRSDPVTARQTLQAGADDRKHAERITVGIVRALEIAERNEPRYGVSRD